MLPMISKIILLTEQHMACHVQEVFIAAVGDTLWDPQDKRCYINTNAKVLQQFLANKTPMAFCILCIVVYYYYYFYYNFFES